MKVTLAFGLFLASAIVVESVVKIAHADSFHSMQVGSNTYRIPGEYPISDTAGMDWVHVGIGLPDWGPFNSDIPNWDNHLYLSVSISSETVPELWGRLYDGSPNIESIGVPESEVQTVRDGFNTVQTYRDDLGFMVRELAKGQDVVLPDQDHDDMPQGFLLCTNPTAIPSPSGPGCKYFFEHAGLRWELHFGRQFLPQYMEFRERAIALMDDWRVDTEMAR